MRLFGEIGWEITANEFIAELDKFATGSSIELRINSVGGSVFEGLHIYNRLRMHEGEVHAVIEGLAASMASVIAMAADKVSMVDASLMMIHNPATGAWGDQKDLEKAAETLAKIKETLIDAYQHKTGIDREQIAAMMDEETWLTSAEAVEQGFADEILTLDEDLDIAACLKAVDLTWFKKAPAVSAKKAKNKNFTFVILPDAVTRRSQPAAIAANTGGSIMTPEELAAHEAALREEGRKAEVARRSGVVDVFNGMEGFDELQAQCLDDAECTSDQARVKLLAAVKAKNAKSVSPTGTVHVIEDKIDKYRAAGAAWLMYRAGAKGAGKVAGDNPFRGARLLDAARICLENANVVVRGLSQLEIVNAAISHTVSDFPNLLQDAMHKTMLDGFNTAGDTWPAFCAIGDLSDFRPHYRHIMGSFSDLKTVQESGEFEDGTLDDTRKETITATTKGRILNLSHQAIINDDMSVFSGASRMLGRSARRAVENDVHALLASGSDFGPTMSDGVTLFHANHGNVSTGAPSTAAVFAAIEVLKKQTLPNASTGVAEYIDLSMPPVFVGPIGLAGEAKVINDAQYDHDGTKLQKPNKSRGLLSEIVGTPRRTGLPWFLFANPSELPVIEVGFVQGQREPDLVMDESFRQYGVAWRVVYDYGVAAVNWLGCVRSTGA